MDKERFDALCLQEQAADGGIGTLGEKRLHRVLKVYFEPRPGLPGTAARRVRGRHPQRGGGHRGADPQLRSAAQKAGRLSSLDAGAGGLPAAGAEMGQLGRPRHRRGLRRHPSPKRGAPIDAFYELVRIAPLLAHPHLTLHLLFFDADEYRVRDGWDKSGKRGSTRAELQPLALCAEQEVRGPTAYAALLPAGLPDPFTLPELRAAVRRSETLCRRAVYTLEKAGALSRAGKRGRALLYRRTLPPEGRTPAANRP